MEMNNINYEDYIGREVMGFRFEESEKLGYNSVMDYYIGKVGHISEYYKENNIFTVQFDNEWWLYPADLVIKQLEQKDDLIEMMEKDEEAGIYDTDDDSEEDLVNNPSHYQLKSGIQVIDIIEGAGLGFHLANVIKYVLRAGKKDPSKELEDLKKAEYYLHRKIKELENDEK